jgi:hypothetical protein
MATQIVFETHSITEDNERGIATGWHPGRLSDQGRLLARGLGVLAAVSFTWQAGWE